MTGNIVIARITVMLSLLLLTACSLVPPDYAEGGCCLAVKFVQGDKTIAKLTYPANGSTYQQILAVATDRGGVKSINLSFSSTVAPCFDPITGRTYKRNTDGLPFSYRPVAADATLVSTPVGPGAGRVPSELPALSQLQGPYTCVQDISTHVMYPVGAITATATAINYSGFTASAQLRITFSYEPYFAGENSHPPTPSREM
jgi:hypothetical protein